MRLKKLTPRRLIQALAAATDTDRATAARVLEAFTALALREVAENGNFAWPGVGKLVKRTRKAFLARSAKNGEWVPVAEKTSVRFLVERNVKRSLLDRKESD